MINMKPFNLEEALSGKKIVTRAGYTARILATDIKGVPFNIAVAADTFNGTECIYTVNITGHVYTSNDSKSDLFMAKTTKEGWINIYKNGSTGSHVYPTEAVAIKASGTGFSYVATAKVEWEE